MVRLDNKPFIGPNLNRRGLIFLGRHTQLYEPKLRWKRSSKSHKFSSGKTFESDVRNLAGFENEISLSDCLLPSEPSLA